MSGLRWASFILRAVLLLGLIVLAARGAAWVADKIGTVVLYVEGTKIEMTLQMFAILLGIAIAAAMMVLSVIIMLPFSFPVREDVFPDRYCFHCSYRCCTRLHNRDSVDIWSFVMEATDYLWRLCRIHHCYVIAAHVTPSSAARPRRMRR